MNKFIKNLGLKIQTIWYKYCKSDETVNNDQIMPCDNTRTVLLGVEEDNQKYRSFEDAKTFIKTFGLTSIKEWIEYCKSGNNPDDIPTHPECTYNNKGWVSWLDFLGLGDISKYRSFEDAKTFVKTLGFKSIKEWNVYCETVNKPDDIPSDPYEIYKNCDWKGMGDFLGTGDLESIMTVYVGYDEAKTFVNKLGLKSIKEWRIYCNSGNKPNDIPQVPYNIYKNRGWESWDDFLGITIIMPEFKKYKSFEDAKSFVKLLGFKNIKEWEVYCYSGGKLDSIPSDPNKFYENVGWISWSDFLGNDKQ